jgi:sigma-B regulation protein RsbU (phosphoserine phosphatase)
MMAGPASAIKVRWSRECRCVRSALESRPPVGYKGIMGALVTVKGPNSGQRFALDRDGTLIGRQPDAAVYLESLAVSRHHARVLWQDGGWVVEDVGSSNGTFVNGRRVNGRMPLTAQDALQIGPYVLHLQEDDPTPAPEAEPVVRASVSALSSNPVLFSQNPAYKLQVVLEIAQHLGRTLELDPLLGRLLDHLLRLFPQADRGSVILCQRDQFAIRAQRSRVPGAPSEFPVSRTLLRRALDEGAGLLSEDVPADSKIVLSATLVSLNLNSFLCVPLIGPEGRRLGVLQLDCLRHGQTFHAEDLEVLTAIGLQVAVVLENVALHAERLREERLHQELTLARDIQQSFLPANFEGFPNNDPELFARVNPALEMSGDLYDFLRLPDGRLAFFVGDVSGKGMPAALFMVAVRALLRHLTPSATGPADLLRRLHHALAADNPTDRYVTLVHGIYAPADGSVVLAVAGHPPPLLRRADGTVTPAPVQRSIFLGCPSVTLTVGDTRLTLAPGETLVCYTDGFTEAFAPDRTMFGLERLCDALGGPRTALPLQECAAAVSSAVRRFTGKDELQDDQTLLLLRRPA